MRIQLVKEIQWKVLTLLGSALTAVMIGTANLFARLYDSNVLQAGPGRWPLAFLFPIGAFILLLLHALVVLLRLLPPPLAYAVCAVAGERAAAARAAAVREVLAHLLARLRLHSGHSGGGE